MNGFLQYNGDLKAMGTVEVPLVPMLEEVSSNDAAASGGIPCL